MQPATPKSEFLAGVKSMLPLLVGVAPFGMIFGALALTNGLSVPATLAMSAFVYAGSAQFIAANLVGTGASAWLIIGTTFVVNLRHLLYSVTMAPHLTHLPHRWQAMLAFWLTDESFVMVNQRYQQADAMGYKHWFFLGSAVIMYTTWQVSTWLGVFAGQRIADPLSWGLDFALPATFIGMLIPLIKDRATLASVMVAGLVAVLGRNFEHQLGLVVAAILGIVIGVIVAGFQGTLAGKTVIHE